jgi:amino-acid N-acetyltransferase
VERAATWPRHPPERILVTETARSARTEYLVRPARTSDVTAIRALVEPLVQKRILLGKELVVYYEAVQEFLVVEGPDGSLIGCGALHVMWEDLGEVRTLAVAEEWLHHGIGHAILDHIETAARRLGLSRLFCLTFETEFFARHGFSAIGEDVVAPHIYAELLRSGDEGIAEFLDLSRVKPNTLGNTRMLKVL